MEPPKVSERPSRTSYRRGDSDFLTRRSTSLDVHLISAPFHIHHHNHHLLDNLSLGERIDSDSSDDERCLSPLPCLEGCRDADARLLMSPMVNSVGIDRSISLTCEATRPLSPLQDDDDDAVDPAAPVPRQANTVEPRPPASRKSVRG